MLYVMNDGICDFRFAICDLAAATRREARSCHDRGQLAGFLSQRIDFGFGQQAAFDDELATAPQIANRKSKVANP